MNKVFDAYSEYYDLLYQDKDYKGETEYIAHLINTHHSQTKTILELGCGTGIHASLLAQKGYSVFGVDQSIQMLEKANSRAQTLTDAKFSPLYFQGDIRTYVNSEKVDVCLALFHVISYQVTNADIQSTLKSVNHSLKTGGLFVFDVWYGPCVLNEKPEPRTKNMENANISVRRNARPEMDFNKNTVTVNYDIVVKNRSTNETSKLSESHYMRYYFLPELQFFLESYGFSFLKAEQWLTKKNPGADTWGVTIIAKKNKEIL